MEKTAFLLRNHIFRFFLLSSSGVAALKLCDKKFNFSPFNPKCKALPNVTAVNPNNAYFVMRALILNLQKKALC